MKERTEASYPASNHPLALRARGLSTPQPPLTPPLQHELVSLVHKKKRDVITGGTLTHTGVMEDSVGPAEVIYGSGCKHFCDILFIHLSLFKNNLRHLQGEAKCWAVFTLLMYGIYADTLTWIRMWRRAESTKQEAHQTTKTDCNTHHKISCSCSHKHVLNLAACARFFECIFTLILFHASPLKTHILCEKSLNT